MYIKEQHIIKQFLEIIDNYENCPRLNIAQNIFNAMSVIDWDSFINENADFRKKKLKTVSNNMRYHWIAKQCGINKNSVYSWFVPNRDEKIPLKHLLKLSVILSVPLDTLLDTSVVIIRSDVRKKKYNDMYDIVIEQYLKEPSLTTEEIAEVLGITQTTVIRHLKHYKESLT